MMLWEGARCLSKLILRCPEEFRGKHVVELGAGACPLPSIAAALIGADAVSTDGSIDVVMQARRNVAENQNVLGSRIKCMEVQWGEEQQLDEVVQCFGQDVDWVLGADVVYSSEGIDLFFKSAKYLLSTNVKGRLVPMTCSRANP